MIEKKFIKNDLTLKRWRRFKKRKLAVYSGVALIFMVLMTFAAPLISNSKPLIASVKGEVFFPITADYHPKDLGINDSLIIEWRKVKTDWSVWPMFNWDPFESNKEVAYYPAHPSAANPLGTDDRGRDVFARILYGFKYSILYAVLVWFLCFVHRRYPLIPATTHPPPSEITDPLIPATTHPSPSEITAFCALHTPL